MSFDKDLNLDTASDEKIQKTREELIDYLQENGEPIASEMVQRIVEQNQSLTNKRSPKKRIQKKIDQKLVQINAEILETLKKIREEAHDEQDTSIKKISQAEANKIKFPVDEKTGELKDPKKKSGNLGISDLITTGISGALSVLGVAAATKAARTAASAARFAATAARGAASSARAITSAASSALEKLRTSFKTSPGSKVNNQPAKAPAPSKKPGSPKPPSSKPTPVKNNPPASTKTNTPNPKVKPGLGKMLKGFKVGGITAIGLGLIQGYNIINDEEKTAGEKNVGLTGVAGGMAGGAAGAAIGATVGSVIPVVGTAVGGIVGGMVGAYFGEQKMKEVGEMVFANTDVATKYEAMGLINHDYAGNSELLNKEAIKTLSPEEIQELIDMDDWSNEDNQFLTEAKKGSEDAIAWKEQLRENMSPEDRIVDEIKDKHHSELTDSEKVTLDNDKLKQAQESLTLLDQQGKAMSEQYSAAIASGDKKKAEALMKIMQAITEQQKAARAMIESLTTDSSMRQGPSINPGEGYVPESTEAPIETTSAEPYKEQREQMAQQQTEALAQSEKVEVMQQQQQLAILVQNNNINTTQVMPQQDNFRALDAFSN